MDFLRLIRYKNLAIVALVMLSARLGVVAPMLAREGALPVMPAADFALMVAATLLIGAAGYIINDYCDTRIDAVNRPGRLVVGRGVSRRAAIALHTALNLAGVAIGAHLARRLGLWWVAAVYVAVTLVFWFYSARLKPRALAGNLAVAALSFMVPFQVALFELAWVRMSHGGWPAHAPSPELVADTARVAAAYSAFAFLTNLIREIIKDFGDIIGDVRFGRRTLPVVLGPSRAKWVAQGLMAALAAGVCAVYLRALMPLDSRGHMAMYAAGLILAPVAAAMVATYRAREPRQYRLPDILLKAVMLTGTLFCFLCGYAA